MGNGEGRKTVSDEDLRSMLFQGIQLRYSIEADERLRERIVIKVPGKDPHYVLSEREPQTPQRRRLKLTTQIRANAERIKTEYGIDIEIEVKGEDGFEIKIPLTGNGTKHEEPRNPLADSGVWTKLSEYQGLGKNPAEIRSLLDAAERDANAALAQATESEQQTAEFRRRLIAPELKESIVTHVRAIDKGNYRTLVGLFDVMFPEGLDEDTKEALHKDAKAFVLTPSIVAECIAARIGTDDSLEDLLLEAEARTVPFVESEYHRQTYLEYIGAKTLLGIERSARKDRRQLESKMTDVLEDAKAVVEEYEDNEKQWDSLSDNAKLIHSVLAERRDLYERIRTKAAGRPLSVVIPLGIYQEENAAGRSLYFALPTDEATEKSNITVELWTYILNSIRGVLDKSADMTFTTEEVMSSRMARIHYPKKDGIVAATPQVPEIITEFRKMYAESTLSKLGVRIRHVNLGDVSNDE